jgi:ubiquinone/menaquinone biosynthesis C-methylase UbiE
MPNHRFLHSSRQRLRRYLDFNQFNRDKWIAKQAKLLPPGAHVLDVGAGGCPYKNLFEHCAYTSQDACPLSPNQIHEGRYGRIDINSDVAAIPVRDGAFDVVLCTEVLEHVPDPAAALGEFARVLNRGGRLILTAPLGSGIHQQPYHFYGGYTRFWYERFLPAAGFTDVCIETNGGFFEHFGQESQRFASILAQTVKGPLWGLPIRVLLRAAFGIAMPLICHAVASHDNNKDFTVGYFVTATRA